ncbi:MAG: alpha/beta hydrolase [Parabacteroides sp.]|nr:alpha/beta hydrolase [Parabacteroides sp.]
MKLKLIFYLCLFSFFCFAQETPKQLSNRYGMKMTQNDDGSYALVYAKKYVGLINVDTLPDGMVPYTYKPERLNSKDHKGVTTKDFVFKKHKTYELTLTVDFARTDKPAPFVIYIHGGGWARGNNSSSKSLSHYLAKQKGITGVRVSYSLAPQAGVTVKVSLQDIRDAVKYIQAHATELHINPDCFGFLGTSAGAHLAAVAAMTTTGTKAFVGYSGIYDLEKASLIRNTKDAQRIAYFCNRDANVLREASPVHLVPKKQVPACMLVCGTCDVTVECEQSELFATALTEKGGVCYLLKYEYYDHNVSSKTSDKMEEIFFKSVDFLINYIK